MKNNGLFSTLFIEEIKHLVELDDHGRGRMATLRHASESRDESTSKSLWESVIKQAMGYLQFADQGATAPNIYPLYEDYDYSSLVAYLCIVEPGSSMDDTSVGSFWPGKLIGPLKRKNLNWGILTDGERWRLYSLKTAKPYEDYVELPWPIVWRLRMRTSTLYLSVSSTGIPSSRKYRRLMKILRKR
jgi:hypothetical protein